MGRLCEPRGYTGHPVNLGISCKVSICISSERPQEVSHEVLVKSDIKFGFKWKKRGELMEERIVDLSVGDKHGRRVSCKGIYMI